MANVSSVVNRRVMFRNAATRAAQNMKILLTQTGPDQFEARVAGQDVVAKGNTESTAVRNLKDSVMDKAKSNDGLKDFRQGVI